MRHDDRPTPRGDAARFPTLGFIGATSFSGSTLLAFLLNAQPGVVSVGELAWSIPKVNPGSYPCSCGAPIDSCEFWVEVARAMEKRGRVFDSEHWNTHFDVSAHDLVRKLAVRHLGNNAAERVRDIVVRRVPRWGQHLLEVGRQNAALIESITALRSAEAFVDASKDPVRVKFLREYSAVEPYVIHLVRDSPGFVNSYLKNMNGSGAFQTAIGWWNRAVGQMERLRKTTSPERWLRVRYEDLCKNPAAQIERVLGFLGVGPQPPVIAFRSRPHHIIGNRMRLSDSAEIRLDDSWRGELSKSQLAQITDRTRPYRTLLGYGDTRDERLPAVL